MPRVCRLIEASKLLHSCAGDRTVPKRVWGTAARGVDACLPESRSSRSADELLRRTEIQPRSAFSDGRRSSRRGNACLHNQTVHDLLAQGGVHVPHDAVCSRFEPDHRVAWRKRSGAVSTTVEMACLRGENGRGPESGLQPSREATRWSASLAGRPVAWAL
jgi:hypothetical protein